MAHATTTVSIALLCIAVVVLSLAVIRLEKFHYANQVGECFEPGVVYANNPIANTKRLVCLDNAETRTSALWHLYYGAFKGF